MPNHETNNVVIVGDPEKIKKFLAEAFVQPGALFDEEENDTNDHDFPVLVFDLIVPQPENIETGGCSGEHEPGVICWYRWNIDNWGTKWGAYSHSHFQHQTLVKHESGETYGRVDLRFDTAWSAPIPIFEAIQEKWGVTVHAVTQDEGGYPDVEFGDPYGVGVIRKIVTHEFESWDMVAPAPN